MGALKKPYHSYYPSGAKALSDLSRHFALGKEKQDSATPVLKPFGLMFGFGTQGADLGTSTELARLGL